MLSAPVSETTNETTLSNASPSRQPAREAQPRAALRDRHRIGPNKSMRHRAFANAQSTFGNQAVLRMLNRSFHSAAPVLQRKCDCSGAGGDCTACNEKKESALQRVAGHEAEPNGIPPIVHDVLRSPGQPLDAHTRAFMEPRFGYDFGAVRIHAGTRAAESARAVNALAYTVGNQIVFGKGQYAPQTISTRRLMAHELAHVVQQSNATGLQGYRISEPGDHLEQQASLAAAAVMSDNGLPSLSPGTNSIQRDKGDPFTDLFGEGKKEEKEVDPTSKRAYDACADMCRMFPAIEVAPNRFFALCDDDVKLIKPPPVDVAGCMPGKQGRIGLASGGWIMPKNCYVCDGPGVSKTAPPIQLGYIQTVEKDLSGGVYFNKPDPAGDWKWAGNSWICVDNPTRDGFEGSTPPWYGPNSAGLFGPKPWDGSCPELEDNPLVSLPSRDANGAPLRRMRIDGVFHTWLIAQVGSGQPIYIHHWTIENWVVAELKENADPCNVTGWDAPMDMKKVSDKGPGKGSATPVLTGDVARKLKKDCSTKTKP